MLIRKVVKEPFKISLKANSLFSPDNKILYRGRFYFLKIKLYNFIKNAYKQTT